MLGMHSMLAYWHQMSITQGLLITDGNRKLLIHNNLSSEGTPGTPRALEALVMKAQTILRYPAGGCHEN
jgi:hypothetical protein